ncbi:glycosyltransferase family 2 protein [Patescibacteria group bacterium]
MTLSIIIVNWNVKDLLEKCLTSIYKETQNIDFEVIVIDNASSDNSADMVRNKFPQVKLIANKENKWFAGGNNQGIKMAQGDLILLLNPDTVVLDGAVNKMVGIMGGAAVLGCKLLNPDMTIQPSCRKLPCLSDQILILLKLHNFFPNLKPIRKYYMSDYKYNDTREVEQVMGACLMTRKKVVEQIGGLDEKYGSIFEEVDFCRRVGNTPVTYIKEGKHTPDPSNRGELAKIVPLLRGDRGVLNSKIYFTDKAKIIHHKGQSFRQRKIITNQKNFNYALLRYFMKYKPLWQYLIILALWPVSMLLSIVDQLMLLTGIRKFKEKFKKGEY